MNLKHGWFPLASSEQYESTVDALLSRSEIQVLGACYVVAEVEWHGSVGRGSARLTPVISVSRIEA